MSEDSRPALKMAVRAAFAALVLGTAMLFIGTGSLSAQDAEPQGLEFAVRCAQIREGAGGGIGAVTCTLTVTGLPDPLESDVTLTLFSADDTGDGTEQSAPTATVLSAVAPAMTPGPPVLVTWQILNPSLSPLSISPQVPDQPPKSL